MAVPRMTGSCSPPGVKATLPVPEMESFHEHQDGLKRKQCFINKDRNSEFQLNIDLSLVSEEV